MRLVAIVSGALLVTGCASTPTENTAAVDRACSVQDCFLERDVRDFEVIDQTTLIVYVGAQRCAFQLELRGTFCDMTFAPDIYFHSPNDIDDPRSRNPISQRGRGDELFGGDVGGSSNLRICANDLQIDVDGGAFTESTGSNQPLDRFGNRRSQCQVAGVQSITDDQLVELYVARGVVAPPPPMGSGELEVGEQKEPEEGDEDIETGAPEPTSAPALDPSQAQGNLQIAAGRD